MIRKIVVRKLGVFESNGGSVLHGIKKSSPGFNGFGEVYFSFIDAGVIKGWKRHNRMTMNLFVPIGLVQFVFFCNDDAFFRVEMIGESNYSRITVPPKIWFAFKGVSSNTSLVCNFSDIEHDPSEVDLADIDTFRFDWRKM